MFGGVGLMVGGFRSTKPLDYNGLVIVSREKLLFSNGVIDTKQKSFGNSLV